MPSLRYFYLISFILLIAGFSAATVYGFIYVENTILKSTATNTAKASVDQFNNGIWRKYRKPLAFLPCDRRCPKTGNLQPEFTEFKIMAEKDNILSFRLFNENAIETLNKTKTFSDYNPSAEQDKIFQRVLNGEVYSEVVHDFPLLNKSYTAVRALFPLKPLFSAEKDKVPANSVVEVYYDITPLWSEPLMLKGAIIGVFGITLLLLFGTMYIMTSRAEQLLAKQHETNVDLATAAASAEKESKEKSQFLANVSHELRTPLNAIIGFSEIIKDEVMGPLNNQQYKDYISDIYISGVHLLSLINDILDYSKAEAGKLTVDLADVDVTKIMKNSLRLVTPRANEANVELIGEVPKKHYILHTDGKRLKQVLLNLFSNAVKFTPSNGTVTLYAWHNLTENMFVIEVKDTGVGIAPKDISKVMATFGQVENKLSRKYEGTGLGLPLSNKLVELMGGKLDIKSEPGQGTIVSISLPYIEEQGTGTYDEMAAVKNKNAAAPAPTAPAPETSSPPPAAETPVAEAPIAAPIPEPIPAPVEAHLAEPVTQPIITAAPAPAPSEAPYQVPQEATQEATQATPTEPEHHDLPPMHAEEPADAIKSASETTPAPAEPQTTEATEPQPFIMRSSIDESDRIEMPSSFSAIDSNESDAASLDIAKNPATTPIDDIAAPDVIAMPPMSNDESKT